MKYIEPKNVLRNLSFRDGVYQSETGFSVEITKYEDVGWNIEVRYDQKFDNVRRQIFSGGQESLPVSDLDQRGKGLTSDEDQIVIAEDGTFEIQDLDGNMLFKSVEKPFRVHEESINIYEGIVSLKETGSNDRAPFSPNGKLMNTRMVRFIYPRPEGVILGLPGQCGEMNRNGYRFQLYNTPEFFHTPARPPMYQSWPILFHFNKESNQWIGVFHDNPSRTFVDIGDFYPDQITFESVTGNTRAFICYGESLEEVSHKMNRFLGKSLFPPLWSFGYQQCRWSYMSSDIVRDVIKGFRENDIPVDSVYLDIDYMDQFKVFTFNQNTFGDAKELVKELADDGVKTVCIVDPGVKLCEGYKVYDELIEKRYYMKECDGSPYIIKCWPGDSVLPDFGSETVREWWSDIQKDWIIEYGFDGIWNDMNEPEDFEGKNLKTSRSFTERGIFRDEYNQYGMNMARTSKLGCDKARPAERSLIITRSGYPGVQQHSVIWHGDNQAWWEHMRLAIDTCISYSLCGANYTGPDVPGFTGNPSDDLAVRFFQLGTFLPLYRGHSIFFAKDKEPYAYGEEANKLIREAIRLRYSLLREWYSYFEKFNREDKPLMKPIFDENGTLVRDHFMLFDKLLVAPIIDRDQVKKLVYLPGGNWYKLGDTENVIRGNQWLALDVNLQSVPVYVKAGSILVRNVPGKNSEETFKNEESYEVYKDSDGNAEGYWFNDDGISVDSEKGERLILSYVDGQVVSKTC